MELQVNESVELTIIDMKKPVLNVNIPQVKEYLESLLSQYKGIIVTEDSLDVCKEIQKKLNKLSKDIDDRRKEVKKEFSKPVTDFEAECKTLLALIDNVNDPIKDGIKAFDDRRREAKKEAILIIIENLGSSLDDKYFEMLVVDEKYLNVTYTIKQITADLTEKVESLKKMQVTEQQARESISQQIQSVNEMLELVQPLTEKDFAYLLSCEIDVPKAIAEITQVGKSRKSAEKLAAEKAVSAVVTQPIPDSARIPLAVEVSDAAASDRLSLDIWGTPQQHAFILNYLDTNAIKYEIIPD